MSPAPMERGEKETGFLKDPAYSHRVVENLPIKYGFRMTIPPELHPSLAHELPACIRFGTSSWTYEGWKGLIYFNEYKSERAFNRESLGEYVQNPWFRTVGIDSTFYSPPSEKVLTEYAKYVPQSFRWVLKAWERLTIVEYPTLPRYGKYAGLRNEDFLNPALFKEHILPVLSRPLIRPHVGPIVLQFPSIPEKQLSQAEFYRKLSDFLRAMPPDFQFATEIRNDNFLTMEYFAILNESGATHCFNHWHRMPPLKEQMKAAAAAGGLQANYFVARILTPLGVSYEAAVKLFAPYNEIRRPNPEMRHDVRRLALRAIEREADTYILVNNRCEGSAPRTIAEIGKLVADRLRSGNGEE